MKIRAGHISNSSSSSFIIAYPRKILEKFSSDISKALFDSSSDNWYSENDLEKIADDIRIKAKVITDDNYPSYYCFDKDENGNRIGNVPEEYYSDWISSGKTSDEFNRNHICVEISEDAIYSLDDILKVPFFKRRLT